MSNKDTPIVVPEKFNLRVYGVLVEERRLLVTDEFRKGMRMTKLPGGGVEFGEGVEFALKREWWEELNVDIEVEGIFFVNPCFQPSAFDAREQVVSMYFTIQRLGELRGTFRNTAQAFEKEQDGEQLFRWVALEELAPETFTFPIDQALVPVIKQHLW